MMGFLTSIVEEAITKKGTLGQVGFITPSPPLLYTIVGAASAATFTGLAVTFYNATTGKMTARCVTFLVQAQACTSLACIQFAGHLQ